MTVHDGVGNAQTEVANSERPQRVGITRPAAVEPFLRGCAWPAGQGVMYPRADPRDFSRLPVDTWGTAGIPAGVRLEFTGAARAVQIAYRTRTADLGYRGDAAGTTFAAYQGDVLLDELDAVLGDGMAMLELQDADEDQPIVVHLPEGMKPEIISLRAIEGALAPAPAQPRWICYGDSIAEGWSASAPALAWPAVAGRRYGLDVVNLGYAGAARGEIATAEQIAALDAPAVISVGHGTNCWSRTPHSATQMMADMAAFLKVLREGHPGVEIVVCSPVLRPDAEDTRNRLGATLEDLREAIEDVTLSRIDRGDEHLTLVRGAALLREEHLTDGIHPSDEGHRILAEAFGRRIAEKAGALAGSAPEPGPGPASGPASGSANARQ